MYAKTLSKGKFYEARGTIYLVTKNEERPQNAVVVKSGHGSMFVPGDICWITIEANYTEVEPTTEIEWRTVGPKPGEFEAGDIVIPAPGRLGNGEIFYRATQIGYTDGFMLLCLGSKIEPGAKGRVFTMSARENYVKSEIEAEWEIELVTG